MPFIHNTQLNPEKVFLKSSECTIRNNDTKNSSLVFDLKRTIRIPSNVNAFIQLDSFKFINSFYNINSTNNIFYYSLNGLSESLSTIYEIVIPIGNYTITTLVTYINTQLSSDIVLTYNASTFKISFTSSLYTFILRSGVNNCLSVLGFEDNTLESSTITSTNLINLSGTQILYISLSNIIIHSNSSTSATLTNILESINVDVLAGVTQSYYNSSSTKYKIEDSYVSSLNVNIYDENNNLVDFNNTVWYMSLSFIFSYKNEYRPPQTIDLVGPLQAQDSTQAQDSINAQPDEQPDEQNTQGISNI